MRTLACSVFTLLVACTPRDPVPAIHARLLDVTTPAVIVDSSAWDARGTVEMELWRDPGDADPTEVLLGGLGLKLCVPETALVGYGARSRQEHLEVTAQQEMPIVLAPGGRTRASFSFAAWGETPERVPVWTAWCNHYDPFCPLPEGEASLQLSAHLIDSASHSADRFPEGVSLSHTSRPPLDERRPPRPTEPPPNPVGASWSRTLGEIVRPRALAIDELGRITLLGLRSGALFNGLLVFDQAGSIRWSVDVVDTLIPSSTTQVARHSRVQALSTAGGRTAFAGSFKQTSPLAGHTLSPAGGYDVYVWVLGEDGELLWARAFGDAADQYLVAAGLALDGSLTVVARDWGATDWGDGQLPSGPGWVVAAFDPAGQHRFTRRIPEADPSGNSMLRAVFGPQGDTYLLGDLVVPVDAGGGELAAAAPSHRYWLAAYDPSGAHRFSRVVSVDKGEAGLHVDPQGALHLPVFADDIAIRRLDAAGNEVDTRSLGLMGRPRGLALGNDGSIFALAGNRELELYTSDNGSFASSTIACDGGDAWLLAAGPAGDIAITGAFHTYAALDQGALAPGDDSGRAILLARIPP